MMTLNLWRAEWLKTRKRPLNRALLGIMLALLLVFFVVITVTALVDPAEFLAEAREILPFPHNLDISLELLKNLGVLLVVVFVANSIGSEYGRDTWKVILPRYGSRYAFLLTKWAVGLGAMLLLLAAVIVLALVLGWVGSLMLNIRADPSTTWDVATYLRSLCVTILQFVFIGTLTFFGAVATRSTIGAAIIGILVPTILGLLPDVLSFLMEGAPIILPSVHIDNLEAQWVTKSPEVQAILTELFNRSVPASVSVLVVLGYTALLFGGALYLFKRRDLAGE